LITQIKRSNLEEEMKVPKLLIWLVPLAALIVLALAFGLIPMLKSQQVAQPDYWPTDGWRTSTPEEQGWDSAKLAEGLLAMRDQKIDIHSLLLIRNGRVFLDAYFYPYDGQSLHELASETKSVMTTLIAIAAEQGRLDLDDPMLKFFPGKKIANLDARKQKITVRHLASMSSGLECTAAGDEQTLREMKLNQDWTQFALDRKVMWEPGAHFVYCSPAIHLLSPILQQATGMTALDFGKQYLFEPLGIRDVNWRTDPQGSSRGSEGIYLHGRDAAKIGYLWLHGGAWEGQQIVSSEWVKQAVSVQMDLPGADEDDYGYGWWYSPGEPDSYSMIGRGGQRTLVVPEWELIVSTTGGGFDFDQIEPFLVAAIGNPKGALPANPQGLARLEAALAQVVQPPAPESVAPLPETARAISDKTYVFDPNPSGIESVSLVFDESSQAMLHIKFMGVPLASWPVGLDGVYRMSSGDFDLPMGLRGKWVEADTFLIEYDNIANNDHVFLKSRFAGDGLVMEIRETAHEGSYSLEGRLAGP
jgi:CubicO group peptidase (beta-lactamase class C family)